MVGGGSPNALRSAQQKLISSGKIEYFNSPDHDSTLVNVASGKGICLAPRFLNDHTMCSDKCRQKMKTQTKRDFDARAIENEYDHIYKNEAQHWLHYIHRMEKDPECSPERIAEIRAEYEDFKKEAKKRKTAVKTDSPA